MLISEATLGILARMGEILTESFQLVESSAEESLDKMMEGALESLLDEYEVDEEDAVDFLFYVADELAASGELPPFPEEEAAEEEVAAWVGAAGALGYAGYVLKMADEVADEELEEDMHEKHECDCEEEDEEDCDCDEE